MPRKNRKISDIYPYHITARCINKDWFKLPLPVVWSIFCDYLFLTKYAFEIEVIGFVLMDNHFHMIIRTPKSNLSKAMNYFMREVSKEITRLSGRINQTFGGPFHSSLIRSNLYFLHAYKYLYRNPVDAGLCNTVESYPYSTLGGLLGFSRLHIPVCEDQTLFSNVEESLTWLNTPYKENNKDKIKAALKKSEFAFCKSTNYGHPDTLEKELS